MYGVTGGGAYGTANNAHATPAVLGTGIFFSQARKHARLSELIRNGTAIVRTRAQTIPPLQMSPLPLLGALNTSNMLNTGLSSTAGVACNSPSGYGYASPSACDSPSEYKSTMGSSTSRSGYSSAPTTPSDSRPCGSRIHQYQGREQQQHVQWSRSLLASPSSSSSSSSHSPSPSPSTPSPLSPCSSSSNSQASISSAGRLTASTSWESFVSGTPPPRSPRCQLQ